MRGHEMTWQHFLIGYGAIGLVTCFGMIVYKHFIAPPDPLDVVHEILRKHKARHNPKWEVRADAFGENVLGPAVALCLGVMFWPAFVGLRLKQWWSARKEEKVWVLERKHLVQRHDVEELEVRERVIDPLGAVPDLPFGHVNVAWERFKQNLALGDEVWSFSQPCEEFGRKGIRNGYVILHDGALGALWVTDYRDVPHAASAA